MSNEIPSALRGQKYISLTTFRKTGAGVATPVWFGEEDGKLYVMTLSKMGKTKRIRNNPHVRVAPCTIRGKVTGPDFAATARLLPKEDFPRARKTITRKYWMAWITQPFSRADAFIEITFE
ncbi:MAG: PPOX class F420-dependent oxidoreductase [Candidatus Sulfotelmatobacter sp.]